MSIFIRLLFCNIRLHVNTKSSGLDNSILLALKKTKIRSSLSSCPIAASDDIVASRIDGYRTLMCLA